MTIQTSFRTLLPYVALGAIALVAATLATRGSDRNARLVVATQNASIGHTGPSIALQPQPLAVIEGESALFFVRPGHGAAVTYQWYRDGVPIAGATQAGYRMNATTRADDGARFTVALVDEEGGRTVSETATLGVAPANEPFAWR